MDRIKRLFGAVDMTVGNPVHQIVRFAVPMLIGNIAQQLYNTVDSIIVGQFVGDDALSAVGSAAPVLNLMFVLFVGIATGASIMVSQYYGAKMREELSGSIGSCITLTVIASLIVMVVGALGARPLLHLLNTPDEIIDWASAYLIIIFIGIAGSALYNILGGILRGLGDSLSALLYLIIATLLNVALDYVFVVYFDMAVAGVALATIIAQAVSAVLTFLKLMRMKDVFDLKKKYLKPERFYSRSLIRLGLPSGLTQGVFSMSLVLTQALTNSFGSTYIAANVIVQRIDGFAILPAFSFGTAMTTFAGQNIGAGKLDRVEEGVKKGTLLAVSVSTVISAIIILFGKSLMKIFTKTEDLIDISYTVMSILLVGYIIFEVTQCLSGVMRGAGDTVTPMWISITQTIGISTPLAYLLVHLTKTPENPTGNFFMICTSVLISWFIAAGITVIMYKRGKWKNKRLT